MKVEEKGEMALDKVIDKLESSKEKDGYTFLDHLTALFEKILTNPKEYSLDKFEELSYITKLSRFQPKRPLLDSEVRALAVNVSEKQKHICKAFNALKQSVTANPFQTLGAVPDIMTEARMFQWAGVGFDMEEWYLIHKAVKNLAIQTKCTKIRFWGKLLCSKKDLYVIEMKANADENYDPIAGEELRGEGINSYIYWVSSDLIGEWVKLPDLKGEHIAGAKKIKKTLTGDLEENVDSYPFFEAKESFLIRAQIARISASTIIVPKGVYKESEANARDIETADEAAVPGYTELKSPENWAHLNAAILNSGRTKHILPPGTANAEEEMDKLTQAEPLIARLRGINEDEKFGSYASAWQMRVYGDEQQYALAPPKTGTAPYSVLAFRPYKWPGAITVYQSGMWQSLYIGSGVAQGGDSFQPVGPAEIMQDPEDCTEQEEPNPKTALEPIESDTDEEKKEDKGEEEEKQ